ncbi:hypothetical protein [Pseudomonas sp. NPDC007930]|uniref:hypothetical protein n=1 Tax=Pseudomonas sp. NPDC007930 TaxID=3364417 RepID=UPI0036F1114F
MPRCYLLLSALLLGACSPTPPPTDAWLGRWVGVEGLVLQIDPAADGKPGHYRLAMQYSLDDHGTFDGQADGNAITFTRPDGAHQLVPGNGAATGLKWLADKQNCLVVQEGEGYCRE